MVAVVLALVLVGCEKEEGPAEKMGNKVDQAVENLAERVDSQGPAEKAGEQIDQTTNEARQALENAGEAMGDAMQKAGRKIEETTSN
jgi:hypothetical protein